jgi:hypothetical protein
MSEIQEPVTPDTMKARMDELKGATYQVDLTAEGAIFRADTEIVQTVVNRLRNDHNLTTETLTAEGHSSPTNPRLPRNGFGLKSDSYDPLIHLLNKIIDTTDEHTGSYFSSLYFHRFGKEVNAKYGIYEGLKPGGIGLIGDLLTEKVSWEDIEIIIDSGSAAKLIVQQAATYARCCFVNNLRRFFTLAIGFDFKSLEVFVMVFHRSGLSASPPLKLKEKEGFKGLVRHIVGILSIQGEAAYGLDTTRSQDLFHINNRFYQHVHYLHLRDCLRGRATVVHSLKGMYHVYLKQNLTYVYIFGTIQQRPSQVLTCHRECYHFLKE